MEYVLESIRADWQTFLRFAPRFVYGLLLLIVFLLAARYGGRLVANILERSAQLRTNAHFLQNLVTWSIASVGFLLALGLMGFSGIATSLLATGGVVAIVLGFAFREIGENFLAGFFLTFSRPFEIDDLVKTGDLTGMVRSIELRYVHIRTFDACDVFVPSAQIFREPLYNYTRDGLRRPSFTVGVAYHDEPAQVIALLEKMSRGTDGVVAEPRPYVMVKDFAAQYIEYEIFFFLDVKLNKRGYDEISNDVRISCWRALRDAGMTFSTDVSSGIEILSAPDLKIDVLAANQKLPGEST
ncbi:MAG: mechanosensitive ion channel family protein [Gammaproteobacteria bacterium]|nr:mechanosensitive ion channel family protein [Gammaproteobacteria bacterium]